MNSNHKLVKMPSAAELAGRIKNVGQDLLGIAADLVVALDEKPELANELIEHGVNRELIRRLEGLGRGSIHPELVFSTSPGAIRLLKLPLSEQQQALNQGTEVLDDDETTTRIIPVSELTREQAKQAIGKSLTEQRTTIRKRKSKLAPVNGTEDYRIAKDHVITSRPGKWPKRLILQWLSEMG